MKTFIHIPKTGGTTIVDTLSRQILFNKFKRLNPSRFTHPIDFLNMVQFLLNDVTKGAEIEVVGGHFGFGAHPSLTNPGLYFTVLRDPVERVISEYYYMKHKGMYYQDLIQNQNLSLEEYVSHPEIYYLNNLQTRLISGVSYQSGEEVTEDMYQKALENLRKFKAVGLTEQMGSTLALFYILLGWKRLPYYQQSNRNNERPDRSNISPEVIREIEVREKYDIMLYKEAQKIFNKMVIENDSEINKIIGRIMHPRPFYRQYLKVLRRISN